MSNQSSYKLLITKLDSFIRKFYTNKLIKGTLFTVALVLVSFLVFNLLEHLFYFGTGTRKLMFIGFLGMSIIALGFWVLMPLMQIFRLGKVISHEQAALIIGDHFGDVQDKLLNILHLKKQSDSSAQKELIEASINQKSEKVSLVPFTTAINLKKNNKYLGYALPPALLLLFILFAAPSLIKDSTYRIINNNTEFEKAAPFHFTISQDNLSVLQYNDFTVETEVDGEYLPEEVFIDVENYQYRMTKNANNKFSYTFKNVQKPVGFKLFSGKIKSLDYKLEVLPKANLSAFSLALDYPSYTKRKDEVIQNIGDVVIPAGSKISWRFVTNHAENVDLSFSGKKVEAERKGEDNFSYSKRQYKDEIYKIFYTNQYMESGDSVSYAINVIPDNHPAIAVEPFQDSLENAIVYFVGQASDDYGIKGLNFNYSVVDDNGKQVAQEVIALDVKGQLETPYDYLFDINTLEIKPGYNVSYYFEVFDNDGVNGSKSAKTSIMSFEKPTIEEFEEMEDENEEDIKNNLEESIEELKRLQKEMKELKDKLLNEKELDWQDKKELEKILEDQKELQKKVEEAKKKFEENIQNQEQLNKRDEKLLEKQEKLQEMFDNVLSQEQQEMMQKIEDLLEELNKDEALEMMEDFEMSDDEMEQEMDRLLELMKQLELEKELQDQIDKLEELAEEQEELSKETEEESKPDSELQKEQEEINEKFEDIQEKMEEIEKQNEELEYPKDLEEDTEEQMDDIEEDLDDSSEQLEKKDKKSASKSQSSAAGKMKKLAKKMEESMEEEEQEQLEEDMKALRQLLENIVSLSFDQENLINQFNRANVNTPRYVDLVQDQFKIKDDFTMVEDSLQALSKRQAAIETFVTEKVTEIKYNFKESLEFLEQREKPNANQNQRFTMKNLNDLALMLAEAMEQMQKDAAGMMEGSQQCENPGDGKGKGKKKGKGNKGNVPSDKITKGQKGLGKQLKEMAEGMKNGEGGSSKKFAQAAARQAAMRKALEELQQENGEQGKGMSGELQEIIDQMNQTEIDLVNKRLDRETLNRQQQIETRLLEVEKAERQKEYDNKRKGETAQQIERKIPPSIEEYIKKREAEVEMYKTISPSLRPYYRKLVEEYYNALKAD